MTKIKITPELLESIPAAGEKYGIKISLMTMVKVKKAGPTLGDVLRDLEIEIQRQFNEFQMSLDDWKNAEIWHRTGPDGKKVSFIMLPGEDKKESQ